MKELFRDGDWALEQREDGKHGWSALPGQVWEYEPPRLQFTHQCHGEAWSVVVLPEWHFCHECGVAVPAALIGLKALVEWDR